MNHGALTSLLALDDFDRFLSTYWERQPVTARAQLRSTEAGLLEPGAFVSWCAVPSVVVNVVAQGVARPVARDAPSTTIFDAFADGCTLLATAVEQASAPIAALTRALELEFLSAGIPLAAAVSANAFLTPARSRGFDLHYDNHCAFVLQLRGRKQWEVFAPIDELPLDRCKEVMPRDSVGEPVLRATLHAGDALYIPRGFPHWATSTDTASLHITLSLRTVTWADMAGDLSRMTPALRRSLPPATDRPSGETGFPREQLTAAARQWSLSEYRQQRLARSLTNLRPWMADSVQTLEALSTTGLETALIRADTTLCITTTTADTVTLSLPGTQLRLPAAMRPVLEFVSRTAMFRPSELPDAEAEYDRLGLVRRLVTRGLLVAAPDQAEQVAEPSAAPGRADRTHAAVVSEQCAAPTSQHTAFAIAAPGERDLTLLRPSGSSPGRHLDWLVARQPLTDQECDAIIAASMTFPRTDSTTVGEAQHPGRRQVLARQVGADDRTTWFLQHLLDLGAEASNAHYGLRLSGITRPPQYLEYRPGQGCFERHNDYSHDQDDAPRKITVIVQLSAPVDYVGGQLRFHGTDTEDLPCERGTIIVFPSFLYHSVSPVIRGVRRAFVCWIAGPRLT